MPILKIEHLTKTYGREGTSLTALDDINLTVEKGEFVVIIGSSGSGKSTLLHCLGGVDKPDSGRIFIDGREIYMLNDEQQSDMRRTSIGIIYQFYNLIPTLNVKENIILPTKLAGRKVDSEYLNELLSLLSLRDRIKHLPNELSGGQQQRVAIARALINHPAVILADEPTGNLDSKNSREILSLLKEANHKYSQTIVMVTHDQSIAQYADRMITIEDGHIVADEVL